MKSAEYIFLVNLVPKVNEHEKSKHYFTLEFILIEQNIFNKKKEVLCGISPYIYRKRFVYLS